RRCAMGRRLFLLAVSVGIALPMTALGSAAPPKPRQIAMRVAIKCGDPFGSPEKGTLKILANPNLVTFESQPAEFHITVGELVIGGEKISYGLGLRFLVERAQGDKFQVTTTQVRTEVVDKADDRVRLLSSKTVSVHAVKV